MPRVGDPSVGLRRCLAAARGRGVTSWELAEDEARHSIVRSPDHRDRSSDRNTERSSGRDDERPTKPAE